MRPVAAEFVTSVAAGGPVPTGGLPVVALVGRSNVGKSSLINALVRRRLARSGSRPGTTRIINVYKVSTPPHGLGPFLLIDLPGYGYARGGEQARRAFHALTSSFFDQVAVGAPVAGQHHGIRLAGVLLVVDVRHPGLEPDRAALAWAVEREYPVIVVATKADRISRAARTRAMRAHLDALTRSSSSLTGATGHLDESRQPTVPVVVVSAETGEKLTEVWSQLKEVLRLL